MHLSEAHRNAVDAANSDFRFRFGKDKFEIDSEEHEFWLNQYDFYMKKYILGKKD